MKTSGGSKHRRSKPAVTIMALEPRMMFDGAAGVDAAHAAIDAAAKALIPAVPAPVEVQAANPSLDGGKKEVVFVNTSITGYKTLEAAVAQGVEIEELSPHADGLAQIALWAESHSGYDSISIIGHGTEASIQIGATLVVDGVLSTPVVQAELGAIGSALKAGGDFMLYGCDVAKGADGQQFIADIARDTGAVVEAATHLVGATAEGGSWVLDASSGPITTRATPFVGTGWNDVLTAPATVTIRQLSADTSSTPDQGWGSVAIDSAGNLYAFNNMGTYTVSKIAAGTSAVTTYNSMDPLGQNIELASDGSNLYVYDIMAGLVYKASAGSSTLTQIITSANIMGTYYGGIAADAAGDVFIVSDKDISVYKFAVGNYSAAPTIISSTCWLNSSVSQLTIDAAGLNLYESGVNSDDTNGNGHAYYVDKINIGTGAVTVVANANETNMAQGNGVAIDSSGNVFFTGVDASWNASVWELTASGSFGKIYSSPGYAYPIVDIQSPTNIVVDSSGYFYVSDYSVNEIWTDMPAGPTRTISSATYDQNTGVLTLTGTNFTASTGDYTLADLTFTGQGGQTFTLGV